MKCERATWVRVQEVCFQKGKGGSAKYSNLSVLFKLGVFLLDWFGADNSLHNSPPRFGKLGSFDVLDNVWLLPLPLCVVASTMACGRANVLRAVPESLGQLPLHLGDSARSPSRACRQASVGWGNTLPGQHLGLDGRNNVFQLCRRLWRWASCDEMCLKVCSHHRHHHQLTVNFSLVLFRVFQTKTRATPTSWSVWQTSWRTSFDCSHFRAVSLCLMVCFCCIGVSCIFCCVVKQLKKIMSKFFFFFAVCKSLTSDCAQPSGAGSGLESAKLEDHDRFGLGNVVAKLNWNREGEI